MTFSSLSAPPANKATNANVSTVPYDFSQSSATPAAPANEPAPVTEQAPAQQTTSQEAPVTEQSALPTGQAPQLPAIPEELGEYSEQFAAEFEKLLGFPVDQIGPLRQAYQSTQEKLQQAQGELDTQAVVGTLASQWGVSPKEAGTRLQSALELYETLTPEQQKFYDQDLVEGAKALWNQVSPPAAKTQVPAYDRNTNPTLRNLNLDYDYTQSEIDGMSPEVFKTKARDINRAAKEGRILYGK